ncbi:formylglycine-generating enzyme family protein [Nocardia africana]|uniref:Serine/threonine-protein kinase pkn1 n=1 Tax=Nocardia africana TaxID=134964 RepID=A0A379X4Q2_9NOCA|nr:SUMF1/EgtB/PvdO family nonheme iron enzyme [Nocardia africana]MCC3318396.1 formylglycine-generating enzyme family protein [Nocardia africana]SUH72033.1 Serine/threonine-protein kinase pkn1 [Nocardia africana]
MSHKTDGMVWIPPGRAEIGSPETHLAFLEELQHYSRKWFEDEAPQHTVMLDGYWIDRHPVTNAQFAEFADETGWVTTAERLGAGLVYGPDYWEPIPGISWRRPHPDLSAVDDRPNHPVVHVSHDDATAYATWAGKRLPTEDEWEYAAHGPSWRAWPWGSMWSRSAANSAEYWAGFAMRDLDDWKRWYAGHWRYHGPAPATTPVGSFAEFVSPFGVHDMAGNVTEWTSSKYRLYGFGTYDDGFGAAARLGFRVARGGSWKMMRLQTRTSERICGTPEYEAFDLGFRCAATLAAPHPLSTAGRSSITIEEKLHGDHR